jgi:DNA-binding MarR family transcriptional regulator
MKIGNPMSKDFHLAKFLPYRLAVLSERVSRRLTVEYERTHGLSVAEWRVLVHLQERGQGSVRDIHDWVNLDKPRVSRAVARLDAAGLVEKVAGKEDARLVAVSLTAKGADVLRDIIPVVTRIEERLVARLEPEELESLFSIMEKIHDDLDKDAEANPRSRMEMG